MQVQNKLTGIIFKNTGNPDRARICSYHGKPAPLDLKSTPFPIDTAGMPKSKAQKVLNIGREIEAKYTIGFEIEKNEFHRSAVREYPLFCGFERDGSCGYEAVTHILPLIPESKWRNKVFDLFVQAEKIIDDRWSGSDKKCGGHINIAVDGVTGEQLLAAIRHNCGIILALFRNRLKNTYCGSNRRLQPETDSIFDSMSGAGQYYSRDRHHKYQVAASKRDILEFRIPSRVQSVKQLIRRYELTFELVDFSLNNPTGSHKAFLKQIKPIILSMYEGNEEKTGEILTLAEEFRKFIVDGTISEKIAEFL